VRRLVLLLALALPLAAACGATEARLPPAQALFEAQTKTAQVDTYRVWMTGGTRIPGTDAIGFQAEGEFDNATRRGRLTMNIDRSGRMELVLDGVVIYLRMPALTRALPEVKPWIQFDLRRAGKLAGLDLAALIDLGQQQDPARSLQQLQAARRVQEVGKEVVRGVETTHYRMTIDLAQQARLLQREYPAAARTVRRTIQLTGQRRVPMEVWIGGDQLVRRMKWSQRVPEVKRASTTIIMELYDFGSTVDVKLPPRAKVTTFEQLLRMSR
jgi:hypothetical protein